MRILPSLFKSKNNTKIYRRKKIMVQRAAKARCTSPEQAREKQNWKENRTTELLTGYI